MKTFAARLRATRRAAGLTQRQAAKLLGVKQKDISRWETGARTPPDDSKPRTQAEILIALEDAGMKGGRE